MSILGYDPRVYCRGRAAIEARSIGVDIDEGDVIFRCNLVAIADGRMLSYSAGHITTAEARELIAALETALGNDQIHFYPGVSYRHLCRISGREDTMGASCTPPHDIPDQPVASYLPQGPGSELLRDLMQRSETVLREHPVNRQRQARGDIPATSIWLFWGSGRLPAIPAFPQLYHLDAALTSGVDLLRGLGRMAGMTMLEIPGVTDGLDNNYAAQAEGALKALARHDLVVVHVESPDEAAHAGAVDEKIAAIQSIDREVVGRMRSWRGDDLRLLVLPDHATPIARRTHIDEPVPCLLWGAGIAANGAVGFSEAEAVKTGLLIDPGYNIMGILIGRGAR